MELLILLEHKTCSGPIRPLERVKQEQTDHSKIHEAVAHNREPGYRGWHRSNVQHAKHGGHSKIPQLEEVRGAEDKNKGRTIPQEP